MTKLGKELVLKTLGGVMLPGGVSVVDAGLISGVAIREGKVGFLLTVEPQEAKRMEPVRLACERAVAALPGVEGVTAVMTAQGAPMSSSDTGPRERAVWNLTPVENVRAVVAVASGKGGVGKSTVAVCLALALTRQGKRVGLLDADIYGPSLPRMLGLMNTGQPEIAGGRMSPPMAGGIQCMSMGFVTGDAAAVMRGPMISKTLRQLLRGTRWGGEGAPLDALLVDMPPGTGDIHLSMAQQVPLSGAVIVTTPQDVAVMDARKCLQMFRTLSVPVLGVIENMSAYLDPETGRSLPLLGSGGGARLAEEAGVPLLGSIPFEPALGTLLDAGRLESTALSQAYRMVEGIAAQLR